MLEEFLVPLLPVVLAWPGGGCDGILLEGDLVLSINGKPVTKPHDAWQKMDGAVGNCGELWGTVGNWDAT